MTIVLKHNMTLVLFPYQERIVHDVQQKNAIIKMPTGSGKTYVGAELIRRRLANVPNKKAVFFVPTVDLVEQQARAIETWFGGEEIVVRYHGGLSQPMLGTHRVLVSTPSAFLTLQARNPNFHWDSFCICIFDEVHHVLKDHPYRKIAFKLHSFVDRNEEAMQIIGLSASLTYAVSDNQIKKALASLCHDLRITKMCSPSREDLIAGGYKPQQGNVEIIDARETPDGVLPEWERQPHLLHRTFLQRIEKREATDFALLMWDTVELLENHAMSLVVDFISPLTQSKLASWEDYASKLKTRHPLHRSFFQQLESWYVALKLLVVTWEEEEPLTMCWLTTTDSLKISTTFSSPLQEKICKIKELASNSMNFTKLNCLCEQLVEKKARFGEHFRCIVFVQQRISAYVVAHFINDTASLQRIGLVADFVTGKGAITPSIKVSPSRSKATLDGFRQGRMNVLVATATAEEGIDVPAANFVISYNHMKDSVELCQREGRARQNDRAFVVLEQRPDRPVSKLRLVQQCQEEIIQTFNPSSVNQTSERNMAAQKQREIHARSLLSGADDQDCLSVLNWFRQKTKAQLEDSTSSTQDGKIIFTLTYTSIRVSVEAVGEGKSKKAAKAVAAKALLEKLKALSGGP